MILRRSWPCLIAGMVLMLALPEQSPANGNLLAIDVGHSKAHSGVLSAYGKPEFEFNAALAKTIGDVLSTHGFLITLIGVKGDMEELTARTQNANEAGADFFLSVHHDSVQENYLTPWQWQGKTLNYTDHASGFSLFVSRKNPHLTHSLQCATAIGVALREQGLHPSPHHAENLPGENRQWADKDNGVYYYDNLVVLKTAAMPAVLLEAGVIVNRQEEQALQQPIMRNKIATAVEKGLLACAAIRPSPHQKN